MKEKLLKWLRAAGVRALKTVAQTAVATIGTGAVLSEVDWRMVLSASILAGVLSLLTSIREYSSATSTMNTIRIILKMVALSTTGSLTSLAEAITWPMDCRVPPIMAEVCITSCW